MPMKTNESRLQPIVRVGPMGGLVLQVDLCQGVSRSHDADGWLQHTIGSPHNWRNYTFFIAAHTNIGTKVRSTAAEMRYVV